MEKNAYIHFADERDFKEVSVIGKRKSKKNRAVGFVLTAVSAERTSDCSSEIGSSSAQPDENSDESTEEYSWSPEEFSENEETSKTSRKVATGNRKPKASSSKKTTQARRMKNSLY